MLVRAPRLMLMIMEQNGDLLSDPYRMKPVGPSRCGVLTLRAPSSAAELALMFPKRFLGKPLATHGRSIHLGHYRHHIAPWNWRLVQSGHI